MRQRQFRYFPVLWLAAIVVLACACTQPKPVIYKGIHNIVISDMGLDSSTLSMDVDFHNPNDFELQLKKLDCAIFANNNLLGHIKIDTLLHIPANADYTYPASVRLAVKPMLKNAFAAFMDKSVTLHFAGSTKVGRHGFFVNVPIQYTQKQRLDFF